MGAMGAGVDPNAIDPNAVGDSGAGGAGGDSGAGGDPFGLGGDPIGLGSMGMGGGAADTSGGGRGPDTSAASVANTQLQAPYDIQAGGGLRAPGGGPATDQPRPYQNASAALMGGPQVASRTTFGQAPQEPEERIPQDPSQDTPPYTGPASIFGSSDATRSEAWAPLPNTNLAAPDSFSSRFGDKPLSFDERFSGQQPGGATRGINIPPPATPDGSRPYAPESNVGGLPAIPPRPQPYPPESNVGGLPAIPPQPQPSAPVPTPQPRPADAPSISPVTQQVTPPAASPAEAATRGTGGMGPGTGGMGTPQSPLEQIIGQFLQMLGIGGGTGGGMGGVLSPLEHMLARALGINLPQPYPGFNPGFHSPFFQPPGPGQFPTGAVGGRPPLGAFQPPGSPGPPGPPPGPPGAPGNPPSALPPGRRGMPSQAMSYAPQAETKPWPPDVQGEPDPNMPGQDATRPAPPPDTARGIGATPNQSGRPRFYSGNLNVGGQKFRFGSGGGRFPSLPYGTYYLHPGAIGPIGRRIGAIAGISDSNNPGNNTVNDPTYRGTGGTHAREGVEVHPSGNLRTNGCIGVDRGQWRDFARAFRNAASQGPLILRVGPDGASIQPMGM